MKCVVTSSNLYILFKLLIAKFAYTTQKHTTYNKDLDIHL